MTTSRSRARLAGLLVAGVAAVALVAVAPAPTAAADHGRRLYVAIGDSYSAGVGTTGPVTDPTCYRSPFGYPPLVAQQAGWRLDYQACGGATTGDVLSSQLGTLSADTDYVTIGIGGNDIGFIPVLQACGSTDQRDCDDALAKARQALSLLPDSLDRVYDRVAKKAPNARVAVVGYPRLFDRRDCSPLIDVTRPEMRNLNAVADELSRVIEKQAHEARFQYVDVRDEFDGHAICTPKPYINTLIPPPSMWFVDSFHPNRDGYAAYAREVSASLTHRDSDRPW